MSAGSISLTNNSTAITGLGTNFTSDLKANDFIVAVIGGITYTLGVQSVNSATGVTLITAYGGPTASGIAWTAVPNGTLVGITAQVAADVAKAIRGLNLDKANWQQIFSGTGNVTVTLPDGSQYTGPAWNTVLNKNKNLSDLADITASRTNLGLGTSAYPLFSGIELSSSQPYIDFHHGKSTDDFTHRIITGDAGALEFSHGTANAARFRVAGGYQCRAGATGAYSGHCFNYNWNGSSQVEVWINADRVGAITLAAVSDRALKKDITYRDDKDKALEEVMQWKPATFKMKARGIIPETADMLGYIANDLAAVSPECVTGEGLPDGYDLEKDPNPYGAYGLDQVAIMAKMTLAIQALEKQISARDEAIEELHARIKALDGLDA
ncbi:MULTISPECIES: tail fiber domain-containing protein [Pantoea]|jgi:hypothetical protein|uniref:tail fiber domain-containing protein n=1 Tax=Pantoea TaxID=53335 RepID=UPI000EA36275|nr:MULTISPECIES: tail fiber domain-containing protein [Pantoea]MBZ6385549.1 tail fiber domain-containing protein [Pantoea piersonii]MBZ6398907.1 tail fiber domain-containing protein [Pantoea piersonii]MBZ6407595.1 tail fiber domain-containing protein [Pantoea piersonii]MBZ6425454.1 tail fiber domain-containing protein [Pantoea piersonii]NYB01023.1 tail fiber domain-containing protein [Pantoea piersonii]